MVKRKPIDVSHLTALSSDSEDELNKSQSSVENPPLKDESAAAASGPPSHKKKKVKKEKSTDKSSSAILTPGSPVSTDPQHPESQSDSQTPMSRKKKKKHKESKSEKRRKSESETSETDFVGSSMQKPSDALDMHFTSSDVGSQESPTKKSVQSILDSLDTSSIANTDAEKIKSPKKSKKSVKHERTAVEHTESDLDHSQVHKKRKTSISDVDAETVKTPKKSKKSIKHESTIGEYGDGNEGAVESVPETDIEQSQDIEHKKKKKKKKKHRKSISEDSVLSGGEGHFKKDNSSEIQTGNTQALGVSESNENANDARNEEGSADVSDAAAKKEAESLGSSDSEAEADPTGNLVKETVNPLRYNPERFREVSSFSSPWLEGMQKKDTELWLIKVPQGCDFSVLEGETVNWNEKKIVKTETNENENFQSVWEISANKVSDKQGINLTALVPSKKDKMFHSAGKIAGQITLTRGVTVPEYVMPQTGLKIPPQMPQGLKRRHKPFGADVPVTAMKGDDAHTKSAKKKKKEKKKKHGHDADLDTSFKKKKAKKVKTEK